MKRRVSLKVSSGDETATNRARSPARKEARRHTGTVADRVYRSANQPRI
jgi:hypothetical protein